MRGKQLQKQLITETPTFEHLKKIRISEKKSINKTTNPQPKLKENYVLNIEIITVC